MGKSGCGAGRPGKRVLSVAHSAFRVPTSAFLVFTSAFLIPASAFLWRFFLAGAPGAGTGADDGAGMVVVDAEGGVAGGDAVARRSSSRRSLCCAIDGFYSS